MRIIFSNILLLLSAVRWVCCDERLKKFVQDDVDISCGYSETSDIQSVYLMKMDISSVPLIESHKKDETVTEGRYSLYHNSRDRRITVTIHNLSTEDAGSYRCGVATYDDDGGLLLDPVRLEVKHASTTSRHPPTTSTPTRSTSTSKTAPKLESTSAYRNKSTSGQTATIYGGLAAVLLAIGLLIIVMKKNKKKRAKRKETPQSTQLYPTDCEQNDGVYEEIQDTDRSADNLQTPPTTCNSQQQDSLPVLSVYATACLSPEHLPTSTQAASQISATTTATEDTNYLTIYSLATNALHASGQSINEITETYSFASNPLLPADTAEDDPKSEINDTNCLVTNPILSTDEPTSKRQPDSD